MHFDRLAKSLRLLAIALFSIVLAACGSGDGEDSVDAADVDAAIGEMRVVFRDDFGGPVPGARPGVGAKIPKAALPPGSWVTETGYGEEGWGNDEWQYYTNSMDNLFTENGALVIRAKCIGSDPMDDVNQAVCQKRPDIVNGGVNQNGLITSARIITKDRLNVRYGNIKARIKMPSGAGMWPAFWTLGSDIDKRPWPDAGEIDIVEMHYYYSDTSTTHFSTHWSGPKYTDENRPICAANVDSFLDPNEEENCKTVSKTFDDPLIKLTDDFHVYELDWNENRIVGKIDGITYFTQAIDPGTMEEFLKDHFLLLNVAVGGKLGGPDGPTMTGADWDDTNQTDMLVDWVEVSERVPPSTLSVLESPGTNPYFNRIINSAEFNGAFVESDEDSTAVTPLVGDTVLELTYSKTISENGGGVTANFSGAIFDLNNLDLSSYTHLKVSVDISQFPGLKDIGIEFEDSTGAKILVRTRDLPPPTVEGIGNWGTYEIPLAVFAGVDMNSIVRIGLFNPYDDFDNLIAGTLFVDNINFVAKECAANASVTFDAIDYRPDATVAQITVNDTCAASSLVTVKVETATDEIALGISLDAAGHGQAFLNLVGSVSVCPTSDEDSTIVLPGPTPTGLMATYANTYRGPNGTERVDTATDTAGVDLGATVTNFEGARSYIIAADPNQPVEFAIDNDFNLSDFGSASSFNFPVADATYGDVWSVSNGANSVAVFAMFNFRTGFTSGQASINFKVKGMPNDVVVVKFGDADPDFSVDLTDTSLSTPRAGGWYEVSIPMSNFPTPDAYNYLVIKSEFSAQPIEFLVTDIFLQEPVGSVGPECGAPVVAAPTPTQFPADVISLLSSGNAYPPVVVDTWAQFGSATLLETTLDGSDIKRYSNLGFVGIQTESNPVDASAMTYFRLDVWTPDVPQLKVKLVDFLGDGFDNGTNNSEGAVTRPLTAGQWNTIDIPLSEFASAGLTSTADINQTILEAVGGTGTLYVGNAYFYKVLCPAGVGRAASSIGYCDDFETADASAGAIGNGWKFFVNVFNPSGVYLYGYGPFDSPNNTNAVSQIGSAEGGANQGNQSLTLFSDYNNGDHAGGNLIETSNFQEWVLGAGDSATYTLTFDAKAPAAGGIAGASTAIAFIKTLDPNAGFSVSSIEQVDLTGLSSTTWTSYTVQLVVDASAGQKEGHILQFGSLNLATNYEPSAILFDNVTFVATAPPPPPLCAGGAGPTTSPIGFCDDFEAADASAATIGNSWKFFVNVFAPGGAYLYGYGPFDSPNNTNAVSQIASAEGGPNQGDQALALFSDYNNPDHGVGNIIETLNFQEWSNLAESDSATYTLTFDAKMPSGGTLGPSTTAKAFIRTLDPGAGFAVSSIEEVDLSGVNDTTWTSYTLSLVVDASAGQKLGQILQFGSGNTATNYEPSAILFDNVTFTATPTGGGGGLVANGGFETGDTSNWNVLDVGPNTGALANVTNAFSSEGTQSIRIQVGELQALLLEQVNVAAGIVGDGDTVNISYDVKGDFADGGEIQTSLAWASGTTGVIGPNIATSTASFETYNYAPVVTGGDLTNGFNLQIKVVCGGAATCNADVYIDNITVTIP